MTEPYAGNDIVGRLTFPRSGAAAGGSSMQVKSYTYTGTGTATHTIPIPADAKYVLSLRRADSLIFTIPFSTGQIKTVVEWSTPNTGRNWITVQKGEDGLTVTGTDAGQALNTTDIEYVIEYF